MKIVSAATMLAWEQQAFAGGATTASLMETAVRGCLDFVNGRFPKPGRALFLCGSGHNGNDGLWLASLLRDCGWNVDVLLSDAPDKRKQIDAAPVNAMSAQASVWPSIDFDWLGKPEPALVFDCLLGTGALGAPRGNTRAILHWWKMQRKIWHTTVSLDFPSGLDPDSGTPAEDVFRACYTLAIGAVKQGCLTNQGVGISGRIIPVSIPIQEENAETMADFFDLNNARSLAKGLNSTIHKYQRGSVSVFAGSPGFAGAAVLTSRAALRAGAGIVRLFCHPDCYSQLALATPEIMVSPWNIHDIPKTAGNSDAWIIGPGFGTSTDAQDHLEILLKGARAPLVLDADGLTCLAHRSHLLSQIKTTLILTPHEGEFSRLTGQKIMCRTEAVLQWIQAHPQHTLVLKGSHSIIGRHNQPLSYNGSGHPGMATAGSGDVLSGILGSLLAQRYDSFSAARLGAFWHGLAAGLALDRETEQTLIAGDLVRGLGAAWRHIRPWD